MKPGFFQNKKFPFTPKRRKKSLGSQCNNIIDTRHDLAAFGSKLANVSWLRSYIDADFEGSLFRAEEDAWNRWYVIQRYPDLCWVQGLAYV